MRDEIGMLLCLLSEKIFTDRLCWKTSQTFVDSSSASAQGLYFGSVLQDRVYVLSNALIAHWFAFEDRQLGLWAIGVLHYGMVILTFQIRDLNSCVENKT